MYVNVNAGCGTSEYCPAVALVSTIIDEFIAKSNVMLMENYIRT